MVGVFAAQGLNGRDSELEDDCVHDLPHGNGVDQRAGKFLICIPFPPFFSSFLLCLVCFISLLDIC